MLMHILKRLALFLSSLFFSIGIVVLSVIAGIVIIFETPAQIKHSLAVSKVYISFVDDVLTQTENKQNQTNDTTNNLPFNDPAVKAAAESAFPPQLLQQITEQLIDGTYHWLDGKLSVPDFSINLIVPKQNFATTVGKYATQKLTNLPKCTKTQLQTINSNVDAFSLTCLPPGTNPQAEGQKVTDDVLKNTNVLGNPPIFTAQNLPKDSQGKIIFEKANYVPNYFKLAQMSPFILSGFILLMALAVIFLSDYRRNGLRTLGETLTGTGIFIMITAWLYKFFFIRANNPNGALTHLLSKNVFQAPLVAAAGDVLNAFCRQLYIFGGSYIIIGVLLLVIANVLHRRHEKNKQGTIANEEMAKLSDASAEELVGKQPMDKAKEKVT